MSYNFDDEEYEWFKDEFYKLSNLQLNKYKQDQMKRRVSNYIYRRNNYTYESFLELITNDGDAYSTFLEFLTINVSEFFRNPEQWDILREEMLPKIKCSSKPIIRIWSSACSSGEEPYSLAMLLTNVLEGANFEIIATDIDDAILDRAKKAEYRLDKFDKIPEEYKKWFNNIYDDVYEIAPEIKQKVTFRKLNLLKDSYPHNIDLLVCRNVLIYFMEEAKVDIYQKFSDSLVDDGILFVGSSEQISNASDYRLQAISTYFYQKV